MSRERPLRGSCSCGRNRYSVVVPEGATEVAQVLFENGVDHRRHQAAPLAAFLRIPLAWYHSATYSFFPDESHTAIRRAYTSPVQPNAKRCFCGFCGTPLSYWTENPIREAEFISLTLGSLVDEDLREMEDLGLIPGKAAQDAQSETQKAVESTTPNAESLSATGVQSLGRQVQQRSSPEDGESGVSEDPPWFESMLEGSIMGQLTRSRRISRARTTREIGGVQVDWEIIEWTNDPTGDSPSARTASGEHVVATGGTPATTSVVSRGEDDGQPENIPTKRKVGEMEGVEGDAAAAAPSSSAIQPTVSDDIEGQDVDMKG